MKTILTLGSGISLLLYLCFSIGNGTLNVTEFNSWSKSYFGLYSMFGWVLSLTAFGGGFINIK